MNIKERTAKAAKEKAAIMAYEPNIQDILHIHHMNYVPGSKRGPSFTKAGPGRKHKQG